MRSEHQPGAALARKCQSWQRLPDPCIVGDTSAVQWNIKVDAHKHSFAAKLQIADRKLIQGLSPRRKRDSSSRLGGIRNENGTNFSAICESTAQEWPSSTAPRVATCRAGHPSHQLRASESRFTNHDTTASTPGTGPSPGSGSNIPTRCHTRPIFSRSSFPQRGCSRSRRWTNAGCP